MTRFTVSLRNINLGVREVPSSLIIKALPYSEKKKKEGKKTKERPSETELKFYTLIFTMIFSNTSVTFGVISIW